MLDDHRKIIKDSIKNALDIQDKFSNSVMENNFQLLLSQLDFFKVISGLVVGIIGIGYFYNQNLNDDFLIISLIFALITLLFSVSYTREVVDLQEKQNKQAYEDIKNDTDEMINKAIEALKKEESNIYFGYAENRLKDAYLEPQLNYAGEIVVLLFYLSLGFLGLSFLSNIYNFYLISYQTATLLFVVYVLSFNNWAFGFSELLSSNLKRKNKIDKIRRN